jgi:hypothetical protein
MDQPPIVRQSENLVFSNKYVTVYDDPVRWPDGATGNFLRIVESDGRPGVAVLPVAAGRIGLVKTFRYAVNEWEWGIPRGFGDFADVRRSARAELTEELGALPDDLVPLGIVTPNSGLLSSKVQVFLATYSAPASAPLDRDEIHGVRWPTLEELQSEVAAGQISDSFTLAALSLALLSGRITQPSQQVS